MLDCCEPLEKIKAEGITFGKVMCLARCAGAKVVAFRTNQTSINDFRKHVVYCASSEECHLITSYHRGAFKQTGTGHFSPIGGYHSGRDMVLILDVARFKYPPHWVPLSLLWEAMDTIDAATGHHRGFMLVSKLPRAPSLLYTLSCTHDCWVGITKYLFDEVPSLLKSDGINTVQKVLSVIFTFLPSSITHFIKWIAEVRRQEGGKTKLSEEEKGRLALKEMVLEQILETELFKCVMEWLSTENKCCTKTVSGLHSTQDLAASAASVCCQGTEISTGLRSETGLFCKEFSVETVARNGEGPSIVVSSKIAAGNSVQGLDLLVPSAEAKNHSCRGYCAETSPANGDVLTILLLALPPQTWNGLKDTEVSKRIRTMVSTENLPLILQEEVLHLTRQLCLLKRCKDNKLDDDLGEPVV
ncbi:glutathione gamma-glutamylcysteinyltransferase 1-like isoform X2 [Nymphaea colorata]|nr:glutathione gamma-glutamylcysteinyltransferase 1-like isoform X2 [Nymphaea colorata]